MDVIISALLGAICNRMRGGLLVILFGQVDAAGEPVNAWTRFLKNAGKLLNDFVFGVVMAAQHGGDFWLTAFWYSFAMSLGRCFGWGEYIGAMVSKKIATGHEISFIDSTIERFIDRPALWGFLGLTLRGAMWGIMIGLLQHSVIPIIAGGLMGCVYAVCIELAGRWSKKGAGAGWGYGEYIFGALLWGASAYVAKI